MSTHEPSTSEINLVASHKWSIDTLSRLLQRTHHPFHHLGGGTDPHKPVLTLVGGRDAGLFVNCIGVAPISAQNPYRS